MNKIDRETLFHKYLLNEATIEERAIVDGLIADNQEFASEFETQKMLLGFVHSTKRRELKNRFARIQQQIKEEENGSPPIELTIEKNIESPVRTRIWELKSFRYAASVVGLLICAYGIWLVMKPTNVRVSVNPKDSTNVGIDTSDKRVLPNKSPAITKYNKMIGPKFLPSYDYNDSGLGFAKENNYSDSILVIFSKGTSMSYSFQDTIKISTPEPFDDNQKWKVYFDRPNGFYILTDEKDRYYIEKGSINKPLIKTLRK